MLILTVNPGATSTKIAIFSDEDEIFRTNIEHTEEELASFDTIMGQLDFRLGYINSALSAGGFEGKTFDAVCGRGGLLRHVPSGTYRVSEKVLQDVQNPPYGEHASNLGAVLAKKLADASGCPAFFVDPVSVDELAPVARVSGFKGMERESFFHALNQKSMARKAARELGAKYEELNLIVCHLGGGVSVAAHKKGQVVDVYNVKDEGAFGMDRGGGLPVNAVINLCFSGLSKKEVKKMLGSEAGMFSYLGTRDFRHVEELAFAKGDEYARLLFDAFAYQIAKDSGAMAAVLAFDVDAIVLTGGMANSKRLCAALEGHLGKLAKIIVLPGEEEMRSLAEGAMRVFAGEEVKEY